MENALIEQIKQSDIALLVEVYLKDVGGSESGGMNYELILKQDPGGWGGTAPMPTLEQLAHYIPAVSKLLEDSREDPDKVSKLRKELKEMDFNEIKTIAQLREVVKKLAQVVNKI